MGLLDNIAATLRGAVVTISERAEQFRNQAFADSCMACCALVSMADGVMQPEERSKVVACIQNIRDLHVFKATDLRDSFDNFCRLSGDAFSRVEVVKAIRGVRDDRDQSDMVVKIGIIIAKSKGTLAEVEKTVLREIIGTLGLNVADYDLSTPSASVGAASAAPVLQSAPVPATVTTAPPAVAQAQAPAAPVKRARVVGTSLKEAKQGERISLKQLTGAVPARLLVGLGFEVSSSAALTAAAFLFDKEKKLLQRVGLDARTAGGVAHNGNVSASSAVGDDEEIAISLAALPSEATSVVFVIRPLSGQLSPGTKSVYLRVLDPDRSVQLIRFDFAPAAGSPVALIAARIYQNNGEWKFAAVGESVISGDAERQISSFA